VDNHAAAGRAFLESVNETMAKIRARKQKDAKETGANLGFEAKLWQATDALRNNMDAAEYKHVVLGLIFLN
jgi:type I restriction enzyme M protein